MNTRLGHADSISGRLLRAPAKALLLTLALGMAGLLHAQSARQAAEPSRDQSADKPPAGTYSLLYSFQCSPDGQDPQADLIRDASGNLYGTTSGGGEYTLGTVFKLTPDGTETVLHSFAGRPSDGNSPGFDGTLTLDAAGNVYGTTPDGGEFGWGTVFQVTAAGTESVLYNFTGGSDGAAPVGGVVRDSARNLYGTAAESGAYDGGVFFKLTPDGVEHVLYNFGSSSTDGAYPQSNLTPDSSGNLYGTTRYGGASSVGTVFKVTATGVESVLYSFKGDPDGAVPIGGGLLRDLSGNLYGVASVGGTVGLGVVFKLTAADAESVLLNFTGKTGGAYPYDGLARDAAGNLYGTTFDGGSGTGCGYYGCGVLFELTMAGKEIVLHDFSFNPPSDGATPYGGVVPDPSGNLYGTLEHGGAYGCGAVFKYTP